MRKLLRGRAPSLAATAGGMVAWAWPLLLVAQDCNSNGEPDALDISRGTSHDCNRNGVPDECDVAPLFTMAATFELPTPWADSIGKGDLDGDGDLDLVTANSYSDDLTLLLNRGNASFLPGRLLRAGGRPACVILTDLDGDGRLDAA